MPIDQKTSKVIVKTENGLVQVLPETSIAAVDGLSTELAGVVHTTGAETVDGIKSFSKNTMTEAVAVTGSTIDVSTGSFFTKTISADTTFTFTGVPAGKTCVFTLILANGGAYNITWPNSVTWNAGDEPELRSVGKDILTFFTTDGGTTWTEISGCDLSGASLANSGVTAGSYGPSTNETPTYGNTFTVPQITVNEKGQVTAAVNKTVTIPASDNTDTKVDVTLVTQTRAYLLGTTTTPTGSAQSVSAIADDGVYLTETPGNLHANRFVGVADRATSDVDDNPIATTYAKLASPALTGTPTAPTATAGTNTTQIATTAFVANALSGFTPSGGAKEIGYTDSEPTTSSVSSLDDESIIFYEEGTISGTLPTAVTTTGNQTISGTKTFLNGIFGGVWTMEANETAIDLSKGTCFVKTVAANTTFSFTNVPSNCVCCITLAIVNGGNYTVVWPASLNWSNGITPSLTQNGQDILTLITYDGGTTWFGTTTCVGVTA